MLNQTPFLLTDVIPSLFAYLLTLIFTYILTYFNLLFLLLYIAHVLYLLIKRKMRLKKE